MKLYKPLGGKLAANTWLVRLLQSNWNLKFIDDGFLNKYLEKILMYAKYPVNKFIRTTKITFLVLLLLSCGKFLFFKNLYVINYILGLSIGVCLSVISVGYTYFAWRLDVRDFRDWYAKQKLYIWQAAWVFTLPELDIFRLWVNRLFAPLGFFAGIAIVFITLFIMVVS